MVKIAEICCGSLEDALIAEKSGADQIELNSSLYLGGLTPSYGLLKSVLENSSIEVISMARPRPGGFVYNKFEYETLLKDIRYLAKLPIKGVAFGCINPKGKINLKQSKVIIEILKSNNKEVVFHRAFDQVKDPIKGMEELIELGVDRVLTSGQKDRAIDGLDLLGQLNKEFSDKIDLIVGSGVRPNNIEEICRKTGINNFHSSCKKWRDEPYISEKVDYSYGIKDKYEVVDDFMAKEFVEKIKSL